MPELPEVETIRRDLEKEVINRRIKEVEVRPGSNAMKVIPRHGRRKELQDLLAGTKFERVNRVGKRIYLDLDNDNVMVVDMGPAGQLLKVSASGDVAPHTHIVISFTIGGQLRFIDPKLAGEMFVAPRGQVEGMHELRSFLMDPLQSPLAWQQFSGYLEERKEEMKKLLLDDDFICGLGHLYSDEILFGAGIRYDRFSHKLTSQDVRRLYRSLMETMLEAVRARGTSYGDHAFVDLLGNPGLYQLELKVYEREGEFCRRCRHAIVKESYDGHYTYFCPQCQS